MGNIIIDNEYATIATDDGIMIAIWKHAYVDEQTAQKAVYYRLEASFGKRYPLLIDIKSVKKVTKGARDFLASEKGCEGVIASAICINSKIESMIGNFFVRINRPLIPTKIFTDEKDAKEWLKNYR